MSNNPIFIFTLADGHVIYQLDGLGLNLADDTRCLAEDLRVGDCIMNAIKEPYFYDEIIRIEYVP